MYELGEFLGILTAVFFGLALLNYILKFINRHWVNKLPKASKFKAFYIQVMKFVVKNHKWFGLGVAVSMIIHLILQITYAWVSTTGLIAISLMAVDVLIGAYLHFRLKGKRGLLLKVHQGMGLVLIVAVAVHVITKL